jgi:exodeoxyribonuclease VII small subunit
VTGDRTTRQDDDVTTRPTDQPGPDGDVDDVDDVEGLAYGDAVAELEAILAAIEDDAVDIDQLSRQVRRAAVLIRLCQDRIAGARIEVERVVADLAAGLDGDGADDPTGGEPGSDLDGDADDGLGDGGDGSGGAGADDPG